MGGELKNVFLTNSLMIFFSRSRNENSCVYQLTMCSLVTALLDVYVLGFL